MNNKKFEIWGGGVMWFALPTRKEAEAKVEQLKKLMILSFEIREAWV